MGKVRDFKFGLWIDRQAYKPKYAKVGPKERGLCHVTYFYKFCTPTTSMEWLDVQSSQIWCIS